MEKRSHWPSKWIFILAAIGSAAGLGNLWRFPYLAYEHGGATFVLVLILANIIIGIPLLSLEVSLGQMMQKAAPDAMKQIRPWGKYIGFFALMCGFVILSYYMAVMGWGVNYFASSFTLAWGNDPKSFFFTEILQLSDGVGSIGGISWPVFTGFLISWVIVYFCVWKGVKSVSKVIVWTATLPFVILAILILRAISLEGAMEGLKLFFIPEWSALSNPELWIAAFSQVFFSLSLAFGVMIAYGSFNREKTEVTKSVLWITGGNLLVSIMSGVVVFGTLGYMANVQGVPVTEVLAGGPALAFVVFPKAISLLPGMNTLIAVVFFIMVFLLGLDSAFSLLEAFSAAIKDRFPNASSAKVVLLVSIIGAFAGIIFTTKAGLYYLDIVDHFAVNYGLVIIGILEAILIGWFWKGNKLRDFINENSKWKFGFEWNIAIKYVIPIFLGLLLAWNIKNELTTPYEGYPAWALIYCGALVIVLMPVVGAILDALTRGRRG